MARPAQVCVHAAQQVGGEVWRGGSVRQRMREGQRAREVKQAAGAAGA